MGGIAVRTMLVVMGVLCAMAAAPCRGAEEAKVTGKILYVSKLGNNADGATWATAYATIQAALQAVADDQGGHRIVVRPDTYFEANLFPSRKGAEGAYNELIGDTDGKLGSGTTGWIIIDSGDPGQRGFKSYDWWGTIRAYSQGSNKEHTDATFSAIGWDRWRLSRLYVTGGDAGIFFDTTDHCKPFSVVVEDCVSIGRAFGGGVVGCLSRPDEPITFRRCHLWALDWGGDTAGASIRVENQKMPERPDAVVEDSVLVGPQCAFKSGNYGFHSHTRVRLARCKLIALNFSQPAGTPTDGIIQSVQEGNLLQVDLEDCTLMGYKVFGVKVDKQTVGDIGFTALGDVKAYVQYQQEVPKGIHRMGHWPAELFGDLMPPKPVRSTGLRDKEMVRRDMCEISPFHWKGRLCHLECVRPATGGTADDYALVFRDAETGRELGRCGTGYGLASIIVHRGTAYVFASRLENGGWHDVTLFRSADLTNWKSQLALKGENEQLFNSSVCKGPDGFVMAYESNDPVWQAFTVKFATSRNLLTWTKAPEATFGTNRYVACPCIRYARGWYYVLYLEHRMPRWCFETYVTRSRDLSNWELSAANPVLRAEEVDEGINASDPEIIEHGGKTLVYYCVSDQLTWTHIKRLTYPGRLTDFFESWYRAPGIPDWGCVARQKVPGK